MAGKQKLSNKRAPPTEDYESDDGFVEDAPKSKKQKSVPSKSPLSNEQQVDDEGNVYWELSGRRRLQISDFKGNTFVGIREFYEKDGKSLPGKKGIAMSIEQFSSLIGLLPEVEAALREKDIDVPRPEYPEYDQAQTSAGRSNAVGEDEEDEEDERVESKPASKLDKFKHVATKKKNHEATSDEGDDDED